MGYRSCGPGGDISRNPKRQRWLFPGDGPGIREQVRKLREKGFGDDFVMDISEVNNDGEEGEEADIPF